MAQLAGMFAAIVSEGRQDAMLNADYAIRWLRNRTLKCRIIIVSSVFATIKKKGKRYCALTRFETAKIYDIHLLNIIFDFVGHMKG